MSEVLSEIRFNFEKIGPLHSVDIELSNLTIICGKNNTGKTYIAHCIYAVLKELTQPRRAIEFDIPDNLVKELIVEGQLQVNIADYVGTVDNQLAEFSERFSARIHNVFGGTEEAFLDSQLEISIGELKQECWHAGNTTIRLGRKEALKLRRDPGSEYIELTALDGFPDEKFQMAPQLIREWINFSLVWILLGSVTKRVFVSSAERTGAAIFQRELDFTRWKMLDLVADRTEKVDPWDIIETSVSDYPVAVTANVDFVRDLPNIVKRMSSLSTSHPEVLEELSGIVGGSFEVDDGGITYVPVPAKGNRKKVRIPISSASSTIRSLVDLTYYLTHVAAVGDTLIIDEPEMNLHPDNQRKIARVIALLCNLGVRVIITTHSDYLLRELSILTMGFDDPGLLKSLDESISEEMILDPSTVNAYVTGQAPVRMAAYKNRVQRLTARPVPVTVEDGISSEVFDEVIDSQNVLFENLHWR